MAASDSAVSAVGTPLSFPSPFLNVPGNCTLQTIMTDDKFTIHAYQNLYCETFRDFRRSPMKTKMLEIGFGCGHHVNGRSSLIWTTWFAAAGGAGLELHEVDLNTTEHQVCVQKYLKEHPNVVAGIYLGDQADRKFLWQLVNQTGPDYDIIIDDGGHGWWHQRPSFEVLWYTVRPGGVYVIEDLHISSSAEGMPRDILGWMDMLATARYPSHRAWVQNQSAPIAWVKWPWQDLPAGMASVHVQSEVALFRRQWPPAGAVRTTSAKSYFNVNHCKLTDLVHKHKVHKFGNHSSYTEMYCETLRDFKRRRGRRRVRVLLIGLDCADAAHGRTFAHVLMEFLRDASGDGVDIFGVGDANDNPATCRQNYGNVTKGLFFGDVLSPTFLPGEVVSATGGWWDLVIDDGIRPTQSLLYPQQKRSFETLWPHVQAGGLYFMEALSRSSSADGMVRELLGWADTLMAPMQRVYNPKTANWTEWNTTQPRGLLAVHCQLEICALRKRYDGLLK